jgi:outer membrane receptor protein involved in Fe transport
VGRRLTLQHNHVGTAVPVNVTVNLPPLAGFRLSATAYNLLNQTYDDPGAPENVQDRIEQDGATFRVQLTYEF